MAASQGSTRARRRSPSAHATAVYATAVSRMDGAVALDVQDDGVEFDVARPAEPGPGGGFGLGNLRRRVEALGGTLGVESGRREGTTVTAQWDAGVSAPAPATVATSPGPP